MHKKDIKEGLISIVIPVYNENKIILKTINECIKSLNGIDYEIIIVDDGSLDGTYEKVKEFAEKFKNIRVVTYRDNHGKGCAVRYGFKYAIGNLVVFIDGDLNIHPRQILGMYEKMKISGSDIIVGSKRHKDSNIAYPINRKIYSDIYYLMVRILFGIPVKDTQVGLKLYKREVLEKVCPIVLVKRYAFDIEILANAHRLGYKIEEIGVDINMDFSGHVNKKEIWNMLWDTCAVFYRMKILKYYDKQLKKIYQIYDNSEDI